MRKIFRKIFRYKLTSIFFIIGQLIIYITIFGALAVYNRAYDKEKDRINAVYKNRIELEINMSKKADFMSFFADSTNTGNAVISGKLALGIQELGTSVRSEIIIMSNEQMNYKLESGRLPGENAKNGRLEVAVGRNKAKFATVENGKKYLVIEGDRYEISGILGSDKSDYWDNKVVLNIACLGDKTLNSLMKKMSYTVELGSNSYELDDTYKTVYGNIKSIDQDSVIKAKKLISNGESTLEKSMAKENMQVNVITYIFCVLNSMIISEFWIIQRRKEFAIKKALGMKNSKIIMEMFINITELSGISLIMFLLLNILSKVFVGSAFIDIKISFIMVLTVIAAIIVTVVASLIYPVYKIFHMNPAQQI